MSSLKIIGIFCKINPKLRQLEKDEVYPRFILKKGDRIIMYIDANTVFKCSNNTLFLSEFGTIFENALHKKGKNNYELSLHDLKMEANFDVDMNVCFMDIAHNEMFNRIYSYSADGKILKGNAEKCESAFIFEVV